MKRIIADKKTFFKTFVVMGLINGVASILIDNYDGVEIIWKKIVIKSLVFGCGMAIFSLWSTKRFMPKKG